MRRSDIFESFVKIATEKGLISTAKAEQTEKTLDNPRWDSRTADEIAKLYNTKPESPKDAEYTRNIIERAHPTPVVIAPSYDKLHGLVENENERQDITLNILMQDPYGGHPNQRKYAEHELVMSLVRVANDLDNRNMDELRVLADACLQQATVFKPMKKTALPILIPIAIALLGALYAQQHITSQEGAQLDFRKLSDAIDSAQKENTNWEVGYQYSPEFLTLLADLKKKSEMVFNAVQKLNDALSKSGTPKTAQELATMSTTSEGKEVADAYEALKSVMSNLSPYFTKVVQELNDPAFRERAIKDRGFFQGLIDKTKVLHSPQSDAALFSNDFANITATLNNFTGDVQKLMDALVKAQQFEQKASADMAGSSPDTSAKPQVDPTSLIPSSQNMGGGTPAAPAEKAPWDDIKIPGTAEGLR